MSRTRLAAALAVVAVSVALPFARTPARTPPGPHPARTRGAHRELRRPGPVLPLPGHVASRHLERRSIELLRADRLPEPQPNTTIDGHPAVETSTSDDGWCQALDGTETIRVMIPRPVPGNWYEMDACLRPPNLPHQTAQISAMLSTIQIAAGD